MIGCCPIVQEVAVFSNRSPSLMPSSDPCNMETPAETYKGYTSDPFASPLPTAGTNDEAFPLQDPATHDKEHATLYKPTSKYVMRESRSWQSLPYQRATGGWAWLPEVISCAVAIVSLIGVVITLAIYDGKPMPQWPNHITINTLVAFLVVVLKALMIVHVAQGESAI